jgi:DNA-binding NtrC family response regulator
MGGEPSKPTALVVDDDANTRVGVAEWIAVEGFEVRSAANLAEARELLTDGSIDLAILDLQLPDGTSIDLVRELQQQPDIEVLIITGHGTVDTAVDALRGGAVDYLTKPVDLGRLRQALARVKRALELREEIVSLRGELRRLGRFGSIIGASQAMQHVYDLINRVAPTDTTVLITGETGVGKELVAQMIHERSRRAKEGFLPINCGAVAPSLIESELFGHEKGSFTGADRQRKGVFERANKGTLLLDEVTEMPAELQVRLLRVLETSVVTRVGGDRLETVNVRVIGATNRDPSEAVAAGRLRQDLLYRLNVFPIHVPPLRERAGDLELLARHFLAELNQAAETTKTLSDAALERLRSHSWPGNVRELKNVIERAFILASDRIEAAQVPLEGKPVERGGSDLAISVGMSVAEAERRLIQLTLDQFSGNKKEAARVLGLSLKTLYNRLREYGT